MGGVMGCKLGVADNKAITACFAFFAGANRDPYTLSVKRKSWADVDRAKLASAVAQADHGARIAELEALVKQLLAPNSDRDRSDASFLAPGAEELSARVACAACQIREAHVCVWRG